MHATSVLRKQSLSFVSLCIQKKWFLGFIFFSGEIQNLPRKEGKPKNSFPSHKTFYHIDNQEWIFFKGIANVSPAGLSFCETFFLQLQIKWKLFNILKFLGRSFLIWWLQVWTDFHKICASKELFLVQRHFKVFFWLIR